LASEFVTGDAEIGFLPPGDTGRQDAPSVFANGAVSMAGGGITGRQDAPSVFANVAASMAGRIRRTKSREQSMKLQQV
jgi:hypothetical protein